MTREILRLPAVQRAQHEPSIPTHPVDALRELLVVSGRSDLIEYMDWPRMREFCDEIVSSRKAS